MKPPGGAPTLYMMGGLPGAGKTTFAAYAAHKMNALHINSVSMRRTMGLPLGVIGSVERIRDDLQLFDAMDASATAALRVNQDVFYDSSHNLLQLREGGRQLASAVGATAILIWIDTPLDIALHRVSTRQEDDMTTSPPLDAVREYFLEAPSPHEPHILINGCLPLEDQLLRFNAARYLR